MATETETPTLKLISADDYEVEAGPAAPADEEFANKVEVVLGYKPLAQRVRRSQRNGKAELLALLREHGIRFYEPKAVARYKRSQLTEANKRASGGYRRTYMWRAEALSDYQGAVPIEALDLALKIKAAAPSVSFEIEALRAYQRPVFDPLLYVRLGRSRLCVAVWDEPGFTAPLMS